MAKQHEIDRLAKELMAEIDADAEALAQELFGTALPDSEKLTRTEYLELVRRNWDDAGFRQRLLDRLAPPAGPDGGGRDEVGLRQFLATVADAFPGGTVAAAAPAPPPLSPPPSPPVVGGPPPLPMPPPPLPLVPPAGQPGPPATGGMPF